MERKAKRIKRLSPASSLTDPSSSNGDASSSTAAANRGSASPERYSLRKRGATSSSEALDGVSSALGDDTTYQEPSITARRSLKRKQPEASSSSSTAAPASESAGEGSSRTKKRNKKSKRSKGKGKARTDRSRSKSSESLDDGRKGKEKAGTTPLNESPACPEEPDMERDISDMAVAHPHESDTPVADTDEEWPHQYLDSISTAASTRHEPGFADGMLHMQFDLFTGGGDVANRLRSILSHLTNSSAGTSQVSALQELSEILSISNEDTLIGVFPCDGFVRELTRILSAAPEASVPQDIDAMDEDDMIAFALSNHTTGNIETMTLACQCLSNLIHALPSSASNIVAHGAIEILCQKLEPSDYIDLPEQALSVLEKLAVQFPRAIVQGGGLNAALKHFHFFTIHLQRSALKTAASCFRSIDVTSSAFSKVIEVIPTLIETLSYPDNTVVDDTCLCWARLIDSCKASKEQLEKIVNLDLLRKLVGLMPVPGNANAVRAPAFTHLLRIFRAISKHSPHLSYQLLELDIAASFYQIITGSTAVPQDHEEVPSALPLNKWKDSMPSIMSILVDLLPPLPTDDLLSPDRFLDSEPVASRTRSARISSNEGTPPLVKRRSSHSEKADAHAQLFRSNPRILKRVGYILVPLLTEIYTSMANFTLRELVTHVLVKIAYFSDPEGLRAISRHVSLSAFLADILAQQDYAALVVDALYQSELLITKVPEIYCEAFEIEGVLHEISTIANMSMEGDGVLPTEETFATVLTHRYTQRNNEVGIGQGHTRRYVILLAQNFIRLYSNQAYHHPMTKQPSRLEKLQSISDNLMQCKAENYALALHGFLDYLNGNRIGISGFELSHSGIIDALLHYLTHRSKDAALRRAAFESTVMQHPSALKTLIDRLQESLSRSESFQVATPFDAFNDGSDNPMAILNKRIRVRLMGEGARIPFEHRNLVASVPIAARLKNLEDYLISRMGTLGTPLSSQGDDLDENDEDNIGTDDESICDPEMVNPFDEEQGFDTDNEDDMVELERDVGEHTITGTSSTQTHDTTTETQTRERTDQNNRRGNWKIQFYAKNNPNPVSAESTLYGIIHQNEESNRSAWTPYYRLSYKLSWLPEQDDASTGQKSIQQPPELDDNPTCLKALELSAALYDLVMDASPSSNINAHSFVNRTLTGKLQRQLEEPLIVASNCLPDWTFFFMQRYPFLFPFETRYQFLQSTSYGYSQLMARWQTLQMRNNTNLPSSQRPSSEDLMRDQPLFHRVARYKAKVPRTQLLASATKLLDQCVGSHATLEVQYMGEEGTGLGPTLEFYTAISKEFCKKSLSMWHESEANDEQEYVSTKHGLFPSVDYHQDTLKQFQTLGHFVAKAMVDFRMIDIPFSPAFFKVLFSTNDDPYKLLKEVDPVLSKSLDDLRGYLAQKKQVESDKSLTAHKKTTAIRSIEVNGTRLDDLCLDFTLPGQPHIKLKKNGENIPVTMRNLQEYLDLLVDKMVGSGVSEQMTMFRQGFNRVFNVDHLKVLTPHELVALFGNSVEDWSYQTISSAIHADHGFTLESETVQNLLTTLAEMKEEERRDFLQFTTGSPRLPIGGWHAMRPAFTVVRKQCEPPLGADDYLPSVMTCANYLKLPDYSSKNVLQQRLLKSMREGKNCFLLS